LSTNVTVLQFKVRTEGHSTEMVQMSES